MARIFQDNCYPDVNVHQRTPITTLRYEMGKACKQHWKSKTNGKYGINVELMEMLIGCQGTSLFASGGKGVVPEARKCVFPMQITPSVCMPIDKSSRGPQIWRTEHPSVPLRTVSFKELNTIYNAENWAMLKHWLWVSEESWYRWEACFGTVNKLKATSKSSLLQFYFGP